MIEVDWSEIASPITSEDTEDLTDSEISEAITKLLDASYSHGWQIN
jgi:hypothetical protein